MSKSKIFVQNHVLEKALGSYRPVLRYGDRLQMYNHLYKVLNSQDKGYTFLEDERNSRVAYPTNKLRLLMKNNLCQSLGAINMSKSDVDKNLLDVDKEFSKAVNLRGSSAKVGVTHQSATAAYAKQSPSGKTSGMDMRGEPVGTIHSGKDGENYKKISANPAVWVKVSTGSVHHEPGGEEKDPMSISHEAREQFHGMMQKIDSKVAPSDRSKIQDKAKEWVTENSKFKHMQAAHNTNEVGDSGKKLPKTAIPESTMKNIFAQGDKARRVRQELIDMIKESHLKMKGGSGAEQ